MKNVLATMLYVSFVCLAVRVQADSAATDKALASVNAALSHYRATENSALLDDADAMLATVLAQAPQDFIAARTEVALLLARHADSTALTRVTALNQRFPDDLETWALLIDAELALGRYAQAESDTQRLLDLRPDYVPGLMRAARLRELFGDAEGAIDLLNASLTRSSADDAATRAALYTRLARLYDTTGKDGIAAQALSMARGALPDFPPALREGVRQARLKGEHAQALQFAEQLYRVLPGVPEQLLLARAHAAAGEGGKAAALFRDFVTRAHAIAAHDDNANLALSSYYAFEGHDTERAVSFAASARAQRADVDTLLTYATALLRADRAREARKVLASVAALGYRDAEVAKLATALGTTLASAEPDSNPAH